MRAGVLLARLRDAYRRWRWRRLCGRVRQTMFALTGDPAILELSDEELQEGAERVREAIREAGIAFAEAAEGLTALLEAGKDAWPLLESCEPSP